MCDITQWIFAVNPDCEVGQDTGNCYDYKIMWYYDTAQSDCLRFWYGGCGGNSNRFSSYEECRSECLVQVKKQDKNNIGQWKRTNKNYKPVNKLA